MPPAKRKTALRSVAPDEAPPAPKPPMTILEAAEADDRLAELIAMRRRLARALDDPNCPPRDMAALSRRQLEIGREIEAMKMVAERDGHGEQPAEDEELDPAAI
jgi:hypothetical protein